MPRAERSHEEFSHFITAPVRWADMDSMGHVNNAVYFTFCESARMSYFEAIEMTRHAEATSHGPALASASLDFRQQVHYPAELEIGVRCPRIGTKSFQLDYLLLRRGDGEVVAEGTSVIAWVDYDRGRAIPLPDTLRRAIRALEETAGA